MIYGYSDNSSEVDTEVVRQGFEVIFGSVDFLPRYRGVAG
jgi:hypothetical protein